MDRRGWRATVHKATNSQTQLSMHTHIQSSNLPIRTLFFPLLVAFNTYQYCIGQNLLPYKIFMSVSFNLIHPMYEKLHQAHPWSGVSTESGLHSNLPETLCSVANSLPHENMDCAEGAFFPGNFFTAFARFLQR